MQYGERELEEAARNRRVRELEGAIRRHRDQRGDDRCWLDDEQLYRALPEGYTPPERDAKVELSLCEKYIACRHNPATEYVSPQRRIEELEAEVEDLRVKVVERPVGAVVSELETRFPGMKAVLVCEYEKLKSDLTRARGELEDMRKAYEAACDRIAAQSDLLRRRSERSECVPLKPAVTLSSADLEFYRNHGVYPASSAAVQAPAWMNTPPVIYPECVTDAYRDWLLLSTGPMPECARGTSLDSLSTALIADPQPISSPSENGGAGGSVCE